MASERYNVGRCGVSDFKLNLGLEISLRPLLYAKIILETIGADYVGAWGLEPPLDTATGGLSPL